MKTYQMSIFDIIDTIDNIDDSVINAVETLAAKHRAKHFRNSIISDLDEFRAFEDSSLTYWLDVNYLQTPATVAVYEDDDFTLKIKIVSPWEEWKYEHTYFVDDLKALQRVINDSWQDIRGWHPDEIASAI